MISLNVTIDRTHIVGVQDGKLVADGPSYLQEFNAQDGKTEDMWVIVDNTPSLRPCIVTTEGQCFEIENELVANAIYGEVRRGYMLQASTTPDKTHENLYNRKEMVAFKIIHTARLSSCSSEENNKENAVKEMAFLQLIGPNAGRNVSKQIACVKIESRIYSVMPHSGAELLTCAGKLSHDEVKRIFKQIVQGVLSLQKMNICHRDLSLENILFDKEEQCCTIIDFGMALLVPCARKTDIALLLRSLDEGHAHTVRNSLSVSSIGSEDIFTDGEDEESFDDDNNNHVEDDLEPLLMKPQGLCGKKNFIAPEILENRYPFDGLAVDNWALGVILFMLFTGRTPFQRASRADKWFSQIQREPLRVVLERWKILDLVPDDAVQLLDTMLRRGVDPKTRLCASEILAHPYLAGEQSC
jgi:serine/threonine protein kinase